MSEKFEPILRALPGIPGRVAHNYTFYYYVAPSAPKFNPLTFSFFQYVNWRISAPALE